MKKTVLCVLTTCIVSLMIAKAGAIKRSDVMSEAQRYANYNWTVKRTNPNYAIYDSTGRAIVGEAYSYGDKAAREVFEREIADSLIPRNWKANLNDSTQRIYTGIDCSGLVTRCWGFSEYNVGMTNAKGLYAYTIPVVNDEKPGDLWWDSAHVFLQSEASDIVYEANPTINPDLGQRVQRKSNPDPYSYQKRSIFPQFSDMSPAPGTTVYFSRSLTIQVIAEGTVKKTGVDSRIDNALMWVDGNPVTPTVKALNGKVYRKSITYKLANPTPGIHRVKVQCDNIVNGIAYTDTVSWVFSNCAVKVTDSIVRPYIPPGGWAYRDTFFMTTVTFDLPRGCNVLLSRFPNGTGYIEFEDSVSIIVTDHRGKVSSWNCVNNNSLYEPVNLTNIFGVGENQVRFKLFAIAGNSFVTCSPIWLVGMPTPSKNKNANTVDNISSNSSIDMNDRRFELSQNSPNPVSKETQICYQLPENCQVSLKVYNLAGQLVNILVDETKPVGKHMVTWSGIDGNGNKVSQGVYLYRLTADSFSATKKLILLK